MSMFESTAKFASRSAVAIVAVIAIVAAVFFAGCGDDEPASTAAGNSADMAFATEMTTHHEGAIEMAESARERANRSEIKKLAAAIIAAQESEIDQMSEIKRELKADGVESKPLGMSTSQMGMDFDMAMLDEAGDFDQAFIDMMIPHHRGAIAMAKLQLDKGTNDELRKMAENVITAQTKEIEQMQAWRKKWYGSELPGANDDGSMDHGSMDHGSM